LIDNALATFAALTQALNDPNQNIKGKEKIREDLIEKLTAMLNSPYLSDDNKKLIYIQVSFFCIFLKFLSIFSLINSLQHQKKTLII
jgi:hypothetical protein